MSEQKRSEIGRRQFIANSAMGAAALAGIAATASSSDAPVRKPGQRSVAGLKHSPMNTVRIGIIGVGGRGMSLMNELLSLEGIAITAVCDTVPAKVEAAKARVAKKGASEPAGFSGGERDFENLCRRDDVDVVYIATPWEWHTPQAVFAMKNGKHAFIEVPAAITLEECWQLVDVAEQTQRHCMMLENCCYGETEMLVLNMVRQGLFGELIHGEAGYLHVMPEYLMTDAPSAVWRRRHHSLVDGNIYPTHGLGPVAQYMGIHHGDRFERLVSMSSMERMLSKLRDQLPAGDPKRSEKYVCGDMNTSLIRTSRGRTIMVQLTMCTPRPYSRINTIAGTGGTFTDYPPRIFIHGKSKDWEVDLAPYQEEYTHPLWKQLKEAAKAGGHGGMDYVMDWRLVQCLREGLPLDMSVYDAAAWSSVFPLSIKSVANGNAPVEVPDFTRGQWA